MTRTMNEEDDDTAGGVAAAVDLDDAIGPDEVPDWVKEGTRQEDYDVPDPGDISQAKPMERGGDFIDPAKGVVMVIKKIELDRYTPKDRGAWKSIKFNVHLQIRDGIIYRGQAKPMYKGKMFFHRFYVAVNRGVDEGGTPFYDFSVNSQGKATSWWEPSGGAWGEYKEFLVALGFDPAHPPKNNKAFQDSLVGRTIIYDVDKVPKEEYDKAAGKSIKVKGEYDNALTHARADKSGGSGATVATPATAVVVAADAATPDWDKADE